MDVYPSVKKEDWVLAIKLCENIDLFNNYKKTTFIENPIDGIQDKLKQSIKELNGNI